MKPDHSPSPLWANCADRIDGAVAGVEFARDAVATVVGLFGIMEVDAGQVFAALQHLNSAVDALMSADDDLARAVDELQAEVAP